MNTADISVIAGFHDKVIAVYGAGTVDAVGWISIESQQARYKILSTLADFTGKSVIDAGCGHADLLPYLAARYKNIDYLGIELMPSFFATATERYRQWPGAKFSNIDFSEQPIPSADYIIACGSLSYRNSTPNYIFSMIQKLFNHCQSGFGFNLLSAIKYPDPAIVSYDPSIILSFCKTLTRKIKFQNTYWPDDFTVMMYK